MNTLYYTTTVIEDINNSHLGFWLLAIAAIIPSIVAFLIYLETVYTKISTSQSFVVPITTWIVLMMYPFYDSYIKEYPRPKNEPVVATLVHTYESEIRSGKQLVSAEFVIYKVPEGEVSFRRTSGVVYSKEAVLYHQF